MFLSKRLTAFVTRLLIVTLTVTSLSLPHRQAEAAGAAACTLADYFTAQGKSPVCATVWKGGVQVAFPKMQWEQVGVLKSTPSAGFEAEMTKGLDRTVVLNQRGAQMLELSGANVARVTQLFRGAPPVVLAQYSIHTAQLRIDAFKAEKMPNGDVGVFHATFTPRHGEMWAASGAYASPSQLAAGLPGPNPFSEHIGEGSIFHSISFAGAQVAAGHAMRYFNAPIGFLTTADLRLDQRQEKSGGAFKKKVKTIIEGYAKPHWYVLGPKYVLSRGTEARVCITTADPCPTHQVASSMVNLDEFQGGNMPGAEDLLYYWEQTKSSLTLIALMVITFVIAFAAFLSGGFMGIYGELYAAMGGTLSGSGVTAALQVGLINALGYGLVSLGVGVNGLGGTAEDIFIAAKPSKLDAPAIDNEHYRSLAHNTRDKLMSAPNNSLSGIQALNRRVQPTANDYSEANGVAFVRDNGQPLRAGTYSLETQ